MEGMASSLSLKADAAATASALSTKATRQDLEEMRADRATRADLTAAALELEAQISNARAEAAAATEDARALCARLERESAAAISDLKAGLASKASVSDVQVWVAAVSPLLVRSAKCGLPAADTSHRPRG